MGAGGINPRVAIGAIFIKHICDLSDREVVQQHDTLLKIKIDSLVK